MTTYYNNKRFKLQAGFTNGVLGLQIENGYYATRGVVYSDNTIGYDNPSVLNKSIKMAVNKVVKRLTGNDAMVWVCNHNGEKVYETYEYNISKEG